MGKYASVDPSPASSVAWDDVTGKPATFTPVAHNNTAHSETFLTATDITSKADLVAGTVPAAQLPSYVDDIIEAANFAALPVTGEAGKIYVTLDDNLTYRWSGAAYVEVSKSLALGETSGTAYRGDRGKTAYDHSQNNNQAHTDYLKNNADDTTSGTITAVGLTIGSWNFSVDISGNLLIKNGVTTVAIIGAPSAGKSDLLMSGGIGTNQSL